MGWKKSGAEAPQCSLKNEIKKKFAVLLFLIGGQNTTSPA
jgi:hypothetical protein